VKNYDAQKITLEAIFKKRANEVNGTVRKCYGIIGEGLKTALLDFLFLKISKEKKAKVIKYIKKSTQVALSTNKFQSDTLH
jgi:hypothetical protein